MSPGASISAQYPMARHLAERDRQFLYRAEGDTRLILRVALSSVIKARGQIVSSMLKSYPNTVTVQDLVNSTSFKETKIGEEMRVLVEIGIAEKCKTTE